MRMTGDIFVYRTDRFRVRITTGPGALVNIESGSMRLVFGSEDLPALDSLVMAAAEARDALAGFGEKEG